MSGALVGSFLDIIQRRRGLVFGIVLILSLLAFELFNFTTTEFALGGFLGALKFLGMGWASILAIAFCFIDFAGIARLFTPESGRGTHTEAWYLLGAWLLAASMNALLTWWGVSLAILGHETLGNELVSREALLRVVPVFIAATVWVIRVLIIGTYAVAGNRLFSQDETGAAVGTRRAPVPVRTPAQASPVGQAYPSLGSFAVRPGFRPAPKPAAATMQGSPREEAMRMF